MNNPDIKPEITLEEVREWHSIGILEGGAEKILMLRVEELEAELQQMRELITQHMGWLKQFSLNDPDFQTRNWKDNMMRIRQQIDLMTHDFRVQI